MWDDDTSIPLKQLHQQVSERLRASILEGVYKPGEWLRQRRIAEELGVSQMPVREALKELAADGLVEHIPYRGVRVVRFSPQDVADLYTHRSCLEGIAAKAAAEKIAPETLAELHHLHEQMKGHLDWDSLSEYRRLNRRFHQTIYSASGRDYVMRTLNQMWSAFPSMLWNNYVQTAHQPLPQRDSIDLGEHAAILAALEAGDGDEAERLMRRHIEVAGRELVAALSAQLSADT